MTEADWAATEQGRAADDYVKTAIGLGVVVASAEIGSFLTDRLGPFTGWLIRNGERLGPRFRESIQDLASQQDRLNMLDPGRDQAVRGALGIIGACSAIEAFLVRFTKNRLREEPSIADNSPFEASALAQRFSLSDPDEILERQWRAIKNLPRDEPDQHVRFETIVSALDRGGQTPPLISHNVNAAYVIRHVWGHNAGHADAEFLRKAPPELRRPRGELVHIPAKDAARYMGSLMAYGMIIANRERELLGLGPLSLGASAETDWGEAYMSLYTSE